MAGRRRTKQRKLVDTIKEDQRVSSGPDKQNSAAADLPKELLELILSPLDLRDNIRASAVCKSWQAVATSVRKSDRCPWLMICPKEGNLYDFYDPTQRKTYSLDLPELKGSRICYAKDGWLLLSKPRTRRVFFFSPYTVELIKLPKLQLAHQIVACSAAPTSDNCILFTVKHVNPMLVAVSTCRPGDDAWTTIHFENQLPFVSSIWTKIVFSRGRFYCLSLTGWLGIYNTTNGIWAVLSVPPPKCTEYISAENWWKGKFMAEYNGDIFVVYTCAAVNPIIYKLDEMKQVWVEMGSLEGMTFFANFLSSHVRADLLGKMRNNVYFSKVLYYGKRCVTYSVDHDRYYPRKQPYDWGQQDPFQSIWIDPPEDVSTIL
ncbi:F-box/kelch-repeat protein At1g57790-like [Sesamum indicum]|uniref:F-box/kelch-repeat protein At1g57790-like n=1 Tax=Sesamum indicum TaxID=4182 RepID=A0A6I9T2T0_SESIN|nr:F-box/kelch-repeat protein At1g57790-like [Sesamum indicum]